MAQLLLNRAKTFQFPKLSSVNPWMLNSGLSRVNELANPCPTTHKIRHTDYRQNMANGFFRHFHSPTPRLQMKTKFQWYQTVYPLTDRVSMFSPVKVTVPTPPNFQRSSMGLRNLSSGFEIPKPENPVKFYGTLGALFAICFALWAKRHCERSQLKNEVEKSAKVSRAKALAWRQVQEERLEAERLERLKPRKKPLIHKDIDVEPQCPVVIAEEPEPSLCCPPGPLHPCPEPVNKKKRCVPQAPRDPSPKPCPADSPCKVDPPGNLPCVCQERDDDAKAFL